MEQFSAGDRPYVRPEIKIYPWIAVVVALLAAAGGYYWYVNRTPATPAPAATAPQPAGESAKAEAQAAARLPAPEPAAKPLPTLENSDSMMRESLAGLIGRKGFEDFVVPTELVRRIVATVDNLPRPTAPRRMLPLNPVPGAFTPDASNTARYAPFVRVMEAVNPKALVYSYVQAYPLFQRAYEELGYPGRYFNDRLLEAIDDLLAAPELAAPPELMRPKVLHEFADPELETRSAGQKIMIRMGAENAAKMKARLREIRQEILAASARKR